MESDPTIEGLRSRSQGSQTAAEKPVDADLIWALVDAAPDALVVIDESGIIELINSQTEEVFGYHRSGLVGQPVEILVPDSVRAVHRAHRTRYRADPSPRPMGAGAELLGRRADGTEFPVEISLSPVPAVDGNQRVVAAIRDITDRLETERHSRAVRHAVDTAVDGIFITDEKTTKFTYVNHRAAAMHGYTVDEMIGMTPLHVAPQLSHQQLTVALHPLQAGDVDRITLQTWALRKDGTEFLAEIHINQPTATAPGGDRPMIAIVQDITDRVEAEQELSLIRARAEVAGDRERVARDLHDQVIGDLFGLGLNMQATIGHGTDEHASQRIQQHVTMIDDIIGTIRNTIFGLTNQPTTATFTDTIEQLLDTLSQRLGHHSTLTVHGSIDDLPDAVTEDAIVVIQEALTNCAKHANATQTTVDISATANQLTVTVTDNGDGLPDHEPAATCLGLDNMLTRAQAHDGYCTIDTTPPNGATLTWSIPMT